MKNLKGTKTSENLAKAFAGESQARNRYTFYATIARSEGFKQIEAIFLETADNEREHAKIFFNFLTENLCHIDININSTYPIAVGTTIENLKFAAEGEKQEWGVDYPKFAKIAKEEGFPLIELAFNNILSIEKEHEQRFLSLKHNLDINATFKKDSEQYWKCRNCGYVYVGLEAPSSCPTCKHPQGYFEIMYDNY